jgi:hypothetical protein
VPEIPPLFESPPLLEVVLAPPAPPLDIPESLPAPELAQADRSAAASQTAIAPNP